VDEPVPADYVAEASPPPRALRELSEVYGLREGKEDKGGGGSRTLKELLEAYGLEDGDGERVSEALATILGDKTLDEFLND